MFKDVKYLFSPSNVKFYPFKNCYTYLNLLFSLDLNVTLLSMECGTFSLGCDTS